MFLCNENELEENKAKGFSTSGDKEQQDIILIKRDGQVYAYKNNCPHTGVNLNWQPDEFMDLESFYLQCSVHGALFNVEDGLCVRGPCVNQSLSALSIQTINGELHTSE